MKDEVGLEEEEEETEETDWVFFFGLVAIIPY